MSHHFTTNPHYIGQEPPSHIRKKIEIELKIQNYIRKEADTHTHKKTQWAFVCVG